MSPQARIKIQEDITVYYHSKYGTAPSEKNVMGTFDSNKPTVYAGFGEEDLPTLTSDSAKFLGWYLDQAFTIPVTVGNMEVSSVYNDDYKLNLYARWQETIYIIESETLTGLADAVRAKTGVSGAMTPAVIGETFENWEVEDKSAELVEGTITNYENSSMTTIKGNAFAGCSRLAYVSFPACTYIGSNAFAGCTSLISVSFLSCTYIGSSAFSDCTNLTSVSFPVCTNVGQGAFYRCSSLTSASFSVCKRIEANAFVNCVNLTSVSLPACTSINRNAFGHCSNLTFVSLPACTSIDMEAFRYCSKLASLILLYSGICKLGNSNAFSKTLIASGTGYIYVPSSLVASYKAATNWTYYSNQIVGI